jgi:hypothetical protein
MECFKYAQWTFIGFVLTLEDKDIIQVDATVIIGVMILLTLSIGFDSSINSQKDENITRLIITLAIIAPFTASAVLAIMTNLSSKYSTIQENIYNNNGDWIWLFNIRYCRLYGVNLLP